MSRIAGITLVLAAMLLPAASAPASTPEATAVPLEQLGAAEPGRRCFTGHPALFDAGGRMVGSYRDHTDNRYSVFDVGDVSFIGGPWNYGSLSGQHINETLFQFIDHHENEYDFIAIFVTQSLNFGAYYAPLQNDVDGIGNGRFNQLPFYGLDAEDELEGYVFMNSIYDYAGGIHDWLYWGQEIGHRWGSYLSRSYGGASNGELLGRDDSHWNFFMQTENSVMEGNQWDPIGGGRFETDHMHEVGYSDLDMYVSGFMAPEDVEDWFLIRNPQVVSDPYDWFSQTGGPPEAAPPLYSLRMYYSDRQAQDFPPMVVQGDRLDLSIDDIIARHGERDPAHDEAQREFKVGLVIMHPSSEQQTFSDYEEIENIREWLVILWEQMVRGQAEMYIELGKTDRYSYAPADWDDEPTWEPDSGPGGAIGAAACGASMSKTPDAAWGFAALLVLPALLRRRIER